MVPNAAAEPCPEGWFDIGGGLGCLFFETRTMNWFGALSNCATLSPGAHLVEVYSELEQMTLIELAKGFPEQPWWLGGTDLEEEGKWVWYRTGQSFEYDFWSPTEPSNASYENCVEMYMSKNGFWHDTNCQDVWASICQLSYSS